MANETWNSSYILWTTAVNNGNAWFDVQESIYPILALIGMTLNSIEIRIFFSRAMRSRSGTILGIISTLNWLLCIEMGVYIFFTKGTSHWVANYIIRDHLQACTGAFTTALCFERWKAISKPLQPPTIWLPHVVLATLLIISNLCRAVDYAFYLFFTDTTWSWLFLVRRIVYVSGNEMMFVTFIAIYSCKTAWELRRLGKNPLSKSKHSNEKVATKVILLVSALYIILQGLPCICVTILYIVRHYTHVTGPYVIDIVGHFLYYVAYCSPDSLVYFTYNRAYKKTFLSLFGCCRAPDRSNPQRSTRTTTLNTGKIGGTQRRKRTFQQNVTGVVEEAV